jgi:DNA-binding transcriptional LysR family regulator
MQVDVVPWSVAGVETVEAGRVDLALVDIHDCRSLENEELFADGFACLVAKSHPVAQKRLTLKTFLAYPHVEIKVTGERTPYIDSSLTVHGVRRRIVYRTPFTVSAALVTATSRMIYTTPRRLARALVGTANLRIVDAPVEFRTSSMEWRGIGALATTPCSCGCAPKFALQPKESCNDICVNRICSI